MPKYEPIYAKNLILDRITRSENYLRPMRDLWNEIYSLYLCYTKNYAEILSGQRANVFVPYVFSKIETKLPRIIQAMVGSEDWFKMIGVGEEDDEVAEAHDTLAKFQFSNEIDTIFFFMTWYKEAMLYGNSFSGVFYEKEVKKVKSRTPKYTDEMGNNLYPNIIGYDFKPKEKTVYDSIALIPFDIFDCYPAPVGNKVNGLKREAMDYFIIRSEPSAAYLKSMVENPEIAEFHGWDKKAVMKLIETKRGAGQLDRNRTERMAYRGMTTVESDDYDNPHYEMFTMWEDDSVISIIENDIVRNVGPDKFPFYEMRKPIVMALDTPVPHEMFALGQIKPILRLQYYAQDLENAKLDSILDIVYPGYFANIEQVDKEYINVLRRNMRGLHPCVGNPDTAIRPIQKTDKSLVATNEQVNLERLINMTLGSSDIISGQPSSKQDTATEIMSQIEQANFRFDLSIRLLKDFSHKELLLMMIDRNTQFCPEEKAVRIVGPEGELIRKTITPDMLIGNIDVMVKTSPMMGNKLAWAQNLIRFLDILNQDNGQHPELVRQIGQALGLDNAEDYIANPAQEALQIIVQASQEGLLQNGEQAALVLKAVLDKLAPPPKGGAIPGPLPGATNAEDVARQTGQI
jgi:hypothetical protein